MNHILYAFLLTTIAGFSTLIGTIVIFISKKKKDSIIISSLGFASGVMILISFTDLIPNSYLLFSGTYSIIVSILLLLISINIGILLSKLLNKFIPDDQNSLYRVGVLSMAAIIFHNIPEGIATYITNCSDQALGLTLTIAIACHNIPEGISIAVPIYYATGSKKKAFLYTFISGISELFGAVIAYLFLAPYVNDFFMAMLYAIIAGIMVYLVLTELLKTSLNYHKMKITWISFMIGCLFIYFNHILFH